MRGSYWPVCELLWIWGRVNGKGRWQICLVDDASYVLGKWLHFACRYRRACQVLLHGQRGRKETQAPLRFVSSSGPLPQRGHNKRAEGTIGRDPSPRYVPHLELLRDACWFVGYRLL
jgi:hypothetical protein